MRPDSFPFEADSSICRLCESSQTGQGCGFAFSQIGKDLVNDLIQTVGCLGLADPGPARHPSCNFRLPHNAFNLPAGRSGDARLQIVKFPQVFAID